METPALEDLGLLGRLGSDLCPGPDTTWRGQHCPGQWAVWGPRVFQQDPGTGGHSKGPQRPAGVVLR